jgi:hypothetical protein
MRKVVEGHVEEYAQALTKDAKSTIVTRVVHEIQALGRGGFVKRHEAGGGGDLLYPPNSGTGINVGCWYVVTFSHAREKISQAFRDLLHQRYKSSIDSRRAVRQQQAKRKELSTPSLFNDTAAGTIETAARSCRPAKKLHSLPDIIVSSSLLSSPPSPSTSSSQLLAEPVPPSSSTAATSNQPMTDDLANLTACLTRLSLVLAFDESFSAFADQEIHDDYDVDDDDEEIGSFFQRQQPPVEAPMQLTPGHRSGGSSRRGSCLPRLSLVFSVHDKDYTLFMEQGMEWLDKPDEIFSMERLNAKLDEIDDDDDLMALEEAAASCCSTPLDVQRHRRDSDVLLEAVTALQACLGDDEEKYETLRRSITRSSVILLQSVLAGSSKDDMSFIGEDEASESPCEVFEV